MSIDRDLNINKIVLYYALATAGWIIVADWLIWNGNQISWDMSALIDDLSTWKFQVWLVSEIGFVITTSWALRQLLVTLVQNTREKITAEFHKESAEEKQAAATAQFQVILDSTKEVYVLLDRRANILGFNKRMEQLVKLLFKRTVNIGDSILWYGDPEAEYDFLKNLDRAFAGERIMVEREIMSGDRKIWVQMQFVPVRSQHVASSASRNENEVQSVAYISLDVTKLREADAAIRRANRELENIRNAVYRSVRVSITDAEGCITFANDSFVQATQYSREELYGKTHSMLRSDVHDDAFYDSLWQTVKNGDVWRGEICNKAKDGSLYWCDMMISPIFDERGVITQYMSIRSDITERKRLEFEMAQFNATLEERVEERTAELQAAMERLEILNAEKDDLMGIVAHDLRNPIASIMLMAEFIDYGLERGTNTMMIQSKAKSIHELGTRTNAIIKHLLESNRLESGKFSAHLTAVDVGDILYAVVQDHRVHAERKHISLTHEVPTQPSIALADMLLVRQVFDNLISNAVKYSPAHTTVRVMIQEQDGMIRVSITDEGPGIFPEELPRIFKKFAHISNKPTAGETSIGLGLSAVKQMMHLMQGTITCESTRDVGTTFTVELPPYHIEIKPHHGTPIIAPDSITGTHTNSNTNEYENERVNGNSNGHTNNAHAVEHPTKLGAS